MGPAPKHRDAGAERRTPQGVSWNGDNATATDGYGDQRGYREAVERWVAFHEHLAKDPDRKRFALADDFSRTLQLEAKLSGIAKQKCAHLKPSDKSTYTVENIVN